MATHPLAREVWVAWEQDGFHGGFRAARGTMQYLGIDLNATTVGATKVKPTGRTYARRLYPGGPTVSCSMSSGEHLRMMGGRVSTASSGDVMYLRGGDGTQDTIRVTGNKRAFAKWIKGKSSIQGATDTITLHGRLGTDYCVVHEAVQTIIPGS